MLVVCDLFYNSIICILGPFVNNIKYNIQYKIHLFFSDSTSPDVQKRVQVYVFLCSPYSLLFS